MTDTLPILYSFRRCPYAIRARFALKYAEISVILREIKLKEKPKELLQASKKGTVPVLILPKNSVIDESLDIIKWALRKNDPDGYIDLDEAQQNKAWILIDENDTSFVKILHKFKYPDFYPDVNFNDTQKKMNAHLNRLNDLIKEHNGFLLRNKPSIADLAIFPFIRQRARIDEKEFFTLPYDNLLKWLRYFYEHPAYDHVMKKYKVWQGHKDAVKLF